MCYLLPYIICTLKELTTKSFRQQMTCLLQVKRKSSFLAVIDHKLFLTYLMSFNINTDKSIHT